MLRLLLGDDGYVAWVAAQRAFVEGIEMPDDVQAILRDYEPSDTTDNAVHVLRETSKYLSADWRRKIAQDIVQDRAQGKLKQLAPSIITGLLTSLKVAGDKTAQVMPSSRIGLEVSLEDLAAMIDKSTTQDEYPDEVTADLETAHIILFAIMILVGDTPRQRMITNWVNTTRLRELKDTFPLVSEDVYAVVLYSNGSLSAAISADKTMNAMTRAQFEDAITRAVNNRSRIYNNSFALSARWERDNTNASADTEHFQAILSTLNLDQAEVEISAEQDQTPGSLKHFSIPKRMSTSR
ncbi:hypothetical protein IFM61606_04146 [Aspergillus udagawae]|uniref:Uncharacterized protein n=1 Tax=Aspergillus udagawae TaxID=91492 RepID=A0ABQ1B6D2_9EURO|nr:hypothetical protein IFM51744_08595 [Aspergillus udagawae]GFF94589.1 hypothetical protein IFM53868_07613 [Aspergillus udagawae]GFG07750.1 hypothetical protein IFM5058_03578 [Aspergillus udagawae]GFG24243.1 hypothetical protein IFM61606_04146 [Aspergillus udagawae]